MKNTFNVIFFVKKKQPKKTGLASIFIRITIDGEQVQFNSKLDVNPLLWDAYANKVSGKSGMAKNINSQLNTIRAELYRLYYKLESEKDYVSPIMLKSAYLVDGDETTLIYQFEKHNKMFKELIDIKVTRRSWNRYELTKKRIIEFMENEYGVSNIQLKKIDGEFIEKYYLYIRNKYHCGNNYALKSVQQFLKIVNYAYETGLIRTNPAKLFKMHFDNPTRIYLTQEEIDTIWKKKFSSERIQFVKDIFIFSCYTGISFIDVINLKESDIIVGYDKNKWIVINRKKTKNSSQIPLMKIPLEIIKKYHKQEPDNMLFPTKSNQKVNEYLNEIATICNIQKKITFHVARHTFATTITLNNGVSIESISKMLGHNSIRTTQIYAKITDQKIKGEMAELINKDF